MFTLQLGYP